MAEKVKTKRIYNPVTKKYYEVRQRTSGSGRAGQIKGLWSNKKKTTREALMCKQQMDDHIKELRTPASP